MAESSDQLQSFMSLANKRLVSTEDFDKFQLFVIQKFDLDTVSSIADYIVVIVAGSTSHDL